MSLHGALVGEYLRWGTLSFVVPASWERSKWRRRSSTEILWPWVLLFAAMALFQIAMTATHPELVTEAYRLM